ncbi:large subunit ribosomal protein LP1 [Nematocida displodere]|uniref:Large subunit ribosomal protein LP1 n=1 Tax=Nematocida displodere TaxID=1805483 RepID=A0A177EDM2_9MICR|nr:large subunit ribosomal protein LP1 [Nematocida displodere]
MIDQKDICVLSTLLLHSTKQEVTKQNIMKVANYLDISVDSYLLELFSQLSSEKLDSLIANPSAGTAAVSQAAAPEAEKKEAAPEEDDEEEEGSDNFDLF